ncbi:hypothetical protein [Stenotrophomonas sp. MMGLT7]|uniref:hypothetical protein n=1 Tax=Stenotrophomonas sp. MMGLT7 TaxID=2901227 RepID=UPI001E2831BC|nr:hypothetical protein [Stenotrophomonas sp. MMGLT7]MCD7096901.1 hypothetical protein [Stenotrophomonas sp. MMGLT7]
MAEQPKFIVFDKRQSLVESIVSDLCTFMPLALLVWISHGSRWWTFFSGALALMWVLCRLCSGVSRRHTFTSADALCAWAHQEAEKEANDGK